MNQNTATPKLRLLSGLIDWFIYFSLTLALVSTVINSQNTTMMFNNILAFIVIVLFVWPILFSIVNSILITKAGGTIGKIVTGTEIAGIDNNPISFKRAFFRNHIAYAVSGIFLGLGFWWVFKDKEVLAWHDMIAQTKVLKKSEDGFLYGLIALVVLTLICGILFISIATVITNPYSTIRLILA